MADPRLTAWQEARRDFAEKVKARRAANMADPLPTFHIDPETGELIDTPLDVLRTFPPHQPVVDWRGRLMTAEQHIEERVAENAGETTRR